MKTRRARARAPVSSICAIVAIVSFGGFLLWQHRAFFRTSAPDSMSARALCFLREQASGVRVDSEGARERLAGYRRGIRWLETNGSALPSAPYVMSARLKREPACNGLYNVFVDWLSLGAVSELVVIDGSSGHVIARCDLGPPARLESFAHTLVKSDALMTILGRQRTDALDTLRAQRRAP